MRELFRQKAFFLFFTFLRIFQPREKDIIFVVEGTEILFISLYSVLFLMLSSSSGVNLFFLIDRGRFEPSGR